GVARSREPPDGAARDAERSEGLRHTRIAGITVRVLLGKYGDLPRLQPADLDQIVHDRVRLFGVTGAIIEHVAIRRIVAEDARAGERAEEQGAVFEGIGDRHLRRWRSAIADIAERLLLLVELLPRIQRSRGLVAVVGCEEPQRPAVDAAQIIDAVEGGVDAELHLAAEFPRRAGEGRDDTEADFVGI